MIPHLRSPSRHARLRAIGCVLFGFAGYSGVDAMMKFLTSHYPLAQSVFLISAFSLVPIGLIARVKGGWSALATRSPGVQVARAIAGLATGGFAYFAFARMPLADGYAIMFASPILLAAASAAMPGERASGRQWAAIALGFGGVLIMLRPDPAGFNLGAVSALASVVAYCASIYVIRHPGRAEQPLSFPFYGNLFAVVLLAPVLPFVWVAMPAADFARAAGAGVLAGIALLVMIEGFRTAPSPVVAPFQYSQMIWGVFYGWILFGDTPTPTLLIGGAVVIAAGLSLVRGEAASA